MTKHKLQILSTALEGEALRWFTRLDPEIQEDYDATIEALFAEFVPQSTY